MAVSVPPEFQSIVAELEARAAPSANGVASGGSEHSNGTAADSAEPGPATNGLSAPATDGDGKASVCDAQRCCLTSALRTCDVLKHERSSGLLSRVSRAGL